MTIRAKSKKRQVEAVDAGENCALRNVKPELGNEDALPFQIEQHTQAASLVNTEAYSASGSTHDDSDERHRAEHEEGASKMKKRAATSEPKHLHKGRDKTQRTDRKREPGIEAIQGTREIPPSNKLLRLQARYADAKAAEVKDFGIIRILSGACGACAAMDVALAGNDLDAAEARYGEVNAAEAEIEAIISLKVMRCISFAKLYLISHHLRSECPQRQWPQLSSCG